MSFSEEIVFACPKCKQDFAARVWLSVNPTVSPLLKEKILEGTLNQISCSSCGYAARSSEPFLYHDMERNLMFYVLPMADGSTRREAEKQIREALNKESGASQPNLYILDSIEELQPIVHVLDTAHNPDGTLLEDLTSEEWKELVDIVLKPPMPWTLDHTCACGEKIRTLCFCTAEGVPIDMERYEPDVRPDLGIECPNCQRILVGFHCEKCNQAYKWELGVVQHASPRH